MLSFITPLSGMNKSGIPKGIRTPVTAVKGQCPRPLDDRDKELASRSKLRAAISEQRLMFYKCKQLIYALFHHAFNSYE